MDKTLLIGVGNAGSQISALALSKYPELVDAIYINSSDADLSMVDGKWKFKIGNDNVEGSAKNRTRMKKYLKKDITNLLSQEYMGDNIKNRKYVFIIVSAAGGTGSGAGPILLELLRTLYPSTNFVLIAVLPQINASLMEQGNALEFLEELYDDLGNSTTYMIYDNETTSDMPPTEALELVNDNIVEDIRVLTGVDNYPTPYESIDEADLESIITTPGRLVVSRINKGLTEKVLEDTGLDDLIIKAIKKSCHTETDRNKKVIRMGVITYMDDANYRLYCPDLPKLADFIGTPIERFNHNAINDKGEKFNFLYLIASGMSPINDRVKKITERVNELKNALASDDKSKFILSGEGVSYDILSARREEERNSRNGSEFVANAIFDKFMKKNKE